jgi:hypothetical protein
MTKYPKVDWSNADTSVRIPFILRAGVPWDSGTMDLFSSDLSRMQHSVFARARSAISGNSAE